MQKSENPKVETENREMNNEMKNGKMMTGGYGKFALMMTISFVIMYAMMFINVSEFNHIYLSLNRFYMALLMVAPMAIVMMGFMSGMYRNKKVNMMIVAASVVKFVLL